MKSIDLSSVDLNLLVAFEALLEEESVTAAAKRLHIGQPAMSSALRRLRSLFDDELFVRVGRQMLPTPKASQLAPEIQQALNRIRQVLNADSFDPTTSGRTFRIGCCDYLIICLAPWLLQQSKGSRLKWDLIHFEKEYVLGLLKRGVIDLALGTFSNLPSEILHCPLIEDRLVGICRSGHPALDSNLSAKDYTEMSHALFTLNNDRVGEIDRALAQLNLQRHIVLTTSYFLVLPSIVKTTDLVAAVPSHLAIPLQAEKNSEIEIFELPVPTKTSTISMVWSKLMDQDLGHLWLRGTIRQYYKDLESLQVRRKPNHF
ncbi:MAG: LysR family transcriptional regulator [Cyanobacteriota bacterium]